MKALLWNIEGRLLATVPLTFVANNSQYLWFRGTTQTEVNNQTIGFFQLQVNTNVLSFVVDRNVAFEVAYIKNEDTLDEEVHVGAANNKVFAYFQFDGMVLSGESALLANPEVSNISQGVVESIRARPENSGWFVPTAPYPHPDWAAALPMIRSQMELDDHPSVKYELDSKYRRAVVQALLSEGISGIIDDVLRFTISVDRYQGLMGFAKFPPLNVDFADSKVQGFLSNAIAIRLRLFAEQQVLTSQLPIAQVDFSQFLGSDQPETLVEEVLNFVLPLLHNAFAPIQQAAPPLVGINLAKRNAMTVSERDLVQHVAAQHTSDVEFGRLYLESVYCTHICVYSPQTKKRAAWMESLIPDEVQAGSNLFYADYSILEGIPRNTNVGYFSPARVAFKLDTNGALRVIAISLLHSRPDGQVWEKYYPYSPSWSVAKVFAKSAAGQVHQAVTHALRTHFFIEPFHIALERCFPLDHVIYRMLKPHMRYTLDINFKARTLLINRNGQFDRFIATGGRMDGHVALMRQGYARFGPEWFSVEADLEARGFQPQGTDLPGYFYAQDACKISAAMERFCQAIVSTTYGTDADVEKDNWLQGFLGQLRRFGFIHMANIPQLDIRSRPQLVQLLKGVMFGSSVLHAAVNFPQFAHYGYVANAPLSMKLPAPLPGDDTTSAAEFHTFLPTGTNASDQFALVYGLSRYEKEERFLLPSGDLPNGDQVYKFYIPSLWHSERYRPACEEYMAALIKIDLEIAGRPAGVVHGTKYEWLRPSRVPTSIAV